MTMRYVILWLGAGAEWPTLAAFSLVNVVRSVNVDHSEKAALQSHIV